MGMLVPHLALN
ncbi:Hypothetical protein LLA12_00947 [Lactococcus lactis subsp. lactis]|nr:Hypothetical protein LLA12_00947 [Lactococcus lactis subsp. lactis]